MRKVIDFHCHLYPEKLAPKAIQATLDFYQVDCAQGKGYYEDLMQHSEAAGIRYHVIHSAATKPSQVRSINNFIAESVAKCPDKLIPFGTLHQHSEDIVGDVEHIVSLGMKGIKIHPDLQGIPMTDDASMRMLDACRGKLIVLFHAGDDRYSFSNPEQLIPVLETFPDVIFVGAHLSAYRIWDTGIPQLAGKYENLYADCSSCFYMTGVEKGKELIRAFGPDRIVFGTDYPIWSPKKELETLLSMGLTEEENNMILWENAAKLLGIE